jgi:hypothetical protein
LFFLSLFTLIIQPSTPFAVKAIMGGVLIIFGIKLATTNPR